MVSYSTFCLFPSPTLLYISISTFILFSHNIVNYFEKIEDNLFRKHCLVNVHTYFSDVRALQKSIGVGGTLEIITKITFTGTHKRQCALIFLVLVKSVVGKGSNVWLTPSKPQGLRPGHQNNNVNNNN